MDPEFLDELSKKLADSLPADLKTLGADIEKNMRAVLQNTLARMQIVTRDEFDVQQAVLQRTREKLEHLEKLVAELEKNHKKTD